MDTDLEWLFERYYQMRKESHNISFLSDWNCDNLEIEEFKQLINNVHSQSAANFKKYAFSYEQFDLKLNIAKATSDIGVTLSDEDVTLTPNSTLSIYLTVQALKKLEIKRVMLFTPAYFSVHHVLKEANLEVIYYHLTDSNNFAIDVEQVKKIIDEQFIQAIFLTDPVYCAGIEHSLNIYANLVEICLNTQLWLIVDYSLGGINWNGNDNILIPADKIKLLQSVKYCLIDSLPKRLMLNGLKFSVVYGSYEIIDKIDRLAESVYGALNAPQISLIRNLYAPENLPILIQQNQKNKAVILDNYRLVKTMLQGTEFDMYATNSGFFSVIFNREKTLEEVNTRAYLTDLLENEGLLAISTDLFSFYKLNNFGIRVNLSIQTHNLLSGVSKLIRM
jgi:aspartate/methionine/tyrosine aminotransferase